jgi:hypothetical protein
VIRTRKRIPPRFVRAFGSMTSSASSSLRHRLASRVRPLTCHSGRSTATTPTQDLEIQQRRRAFPRQHTRPLVRRRQHDASPLPSHQLGAEKLLQLSYLAAVEVLFGRIALRGFRDTAGLGDKTGGLEAVQREAAFTKQFSK